MKNYSQKLEEQLLDQASADGVKKVVVGGVIVSRDKSSILLLQRAAHDFMPNLQELPSGGINPDESLAEALTREVKEETGLQLQKIEGYINSFDYHSKSGKLTRQFNFLVLPEKLEPVVINPKEHSDYCWITLEDKKNLTQKMQEIVELVLT